MLKSLTKLGVYCFLITGLFILIAFFSTRAASSEFVASSVPAPDQIFVLGAGPDPNASPGSDPSDQREWSFVLSSRSDGVLETNDDGVAESFYLERGRSYTFTHVHPTPHPFHLGRAWKLYDPQLKIIGAMPNSPLYGVDGVEGLYRAGDQMQLTIPEDFQGTTVSYYCVVDTPHVEQFEVRDETVHRKKITDTDSDGVKDYWDRDDDNDGVDDHWATLMGDEFIGDSARQYLGYSFALSENGSIIAIASPGVPLGTSGQDKVSVHKWNGSSWEQLGENIKPDYGGQFEGAVSLTLSGNGQILAIGAARSRNEGLSPYSSENGLAGRVMLFEFKDNEWTRIEVGGFRGAGRDRFFGSDVLFASDGTSFVVTGHDSGKGYFTTYEYREREGTLGWHSSIGLWSYGGSCTPMTWLNGIGSDLLIGQYSDDHSVVSFGGDIYARIVKNLLDSSEQGCGDGPFVWRRVISESGPILQLVSESEYVYAEKRLGKVNDENSVSVLIKGIIDGVKSQLGEAIYLDELSDLEGIGMMHLSANKKTLVVSLVNQEKSDALLFEFRDGQWVRIGSVLGAQDVDTRSERLWSLSADGTTYAVSRPYDDARGYGSGSLKVYSIGNSQDAFPLDFNEQLDSDKDGVGNNADLFDDDPFEAFDTDLDGLGNNADLDDDNDGFSDQEELAEGTDPLSRFSCRSGCFSFDVDESLEAQPLTDGLLVIRHLFGFSGDSLTSGAVSSDANRGASEVIASYLTDADSQLDIDGDSESKPLTDGLLLIRYLFGFSGDSLVSGAIGSYATRDTAEEVEAYIKERVPSD